MRQLSRCHARAWSLACALLVCLAAPAPAAVTTQDPALSQICYQAIDRASKQLSVPADVMLAISLTETGRKMDNAYRPWPWTVNMEGKGFWFDTREEALAFVRKRHAAGARSFDVGCFQINFKWHGQHFRSIEDMFDPAINAAYAARFLGELFGEMGSWTKAAGAYHSRTPEFATRYAARFDRFRARIAGKELPVFEGTGSEPLRVAEHVPEAPREPARFVALVPVGWRDVPTSDTEAPLGSLVSGSALLQRNGSLF